MNEAKFYSSLLSPRLSAWGDHCRVENRAATGTPDISYAIEGRQGFIETKIVKQGKLYFEKFQLAWLLRRSRHTRDVFVFALSADEKYLFVTDTIDDLLKTPRTPERKWVTVEVASIPNLYEFLAPFDWDFIKEKVLLGR